MFFISFKNSFSYRIEVLFSIFSSIFYVLISIALWKYVYRDNINKINYMIAYVILVSIINIIYSNIICDIVSQKVIKGTIVIDLLRPINFIWMSYLEMLGKIMSDFILKGALIMLFFIPIIHRIFESTSILSIIAFLVTVAFGHIIYSLMYCIVALFSFIFIEIWPIRRILDDTIKLFAGALLPVSIFPEKVKAVVLVSPLRFLYYSPIEMLIGDFNYENIFMDFVSVITWIILLMLLLIFLYKKVINRCIIQGG